MTEDAAERSERGRIVDLENDAADMSQNNDDVADQCRLREPFEVCMKIFTPLTLFHGPTKIIYNPSKAYENIKAKLQHFGDNGDFAEFDSYSNHMVEKYREKGDFDIVAAVKIEQARCAIYRNNLSAARRFARNAHELAGSTRFPPLFHAQAFLMMNSIYRNKNKLGKTKKYLDLAKQCFESGYSIEDYSLYHELYGSYLDKFLGISPRPDERVKELALTSFKKMSEIGSQHSRQWVNDKKRFYALICSAMIQLDSNSSFGRKLRTVTEESIDLAAEWLGVIKHDFPDSIPRGSKIQFQLVESDLCYRQGKFEDAIELLKKSFAEAKEFGYETEGPKITEVRDDPYWTSRKNSLELIELSSINKVSLV